MRYIDCQSNELVISSCLNTVLSIIEKFIKSYFKKYIYVSEEMQLYKMILQVIAKHDNSRRNVRSLTKLDCPSADISILKLVIATMQGT